MDNISVGRREGLVTNGNAVRLTKGVASRRFESHQFKTVADGSYAGQEQYLR
jgi:hypothetical protein